MSQPSKKNTAQNAPPSQGTAFFAAPAAGTAAEPALSAATSAKTAAEAANTAATGAPPAENTTSPESAFVPPPRPADDRPLKTATDKRVLLALSGGVDSSVAAHLLMQQGWAVEAVVISFSPAHAPALQAAVRAAGELRIPISVLHCEDLFEREVVTPFCAAYAAGRTPNPCVICNPLVKFAKLAQEADSRGIFHIASGHYARCEQRGPTRHIAKAQSAERDQSYMLYRLPEAIRNRLLLPVGEHGKPAVRAFAKALSLSCADAPDSQEICFIPSGDHAAFIQDRGYQPLQGRLIGPDGEDLGPHAGVHRYTIGQRKGLGVALGYPAFVRRIQPNGDVQLARGGGEFAQGVLLKSVVTADGEALRDGERCEVKIRSAANPVPCTITFSDAGLTLRFDAAQRAAAPGQHAVLYKGPLLIGGGEIQGFF